MINTEASATDTAIRVALEGFNRRSVEALAALFKRRCRGRIALSAPANAQVTLFYRDGSEADARWHDWHRGNPRRAVVVASREPPPEADLLHVPVPINLQALEQALRRAAGRTSKLTPSRQRRVQMHVAVERDVFYRPDDYFLGALLDALHAHPGEAVSVPFENCVVLADRQLGRIYTDLPETRWPALAAAPPPAGARAARVLARGAVAALTARRPRTRSYALEPFVWQLAVRTARGRAPAGTRLDEPVYLRRWPNFTRLAAVPDGLRLTALWVQQPRPLPDLCQQLDVPLAHALGLYAATHSIGLAGPARREIDRLIEAPALPTPRARHGAGALLSALLARVTGVQR